MRMPGVTSRFPLPSVRHGFGHDVTSVDVPWCPCRLRSRSRRPRASGGGGSRSSRRGRAGDEPRDRLLAGGRAYEKDGAIWFTDPHYGIMTDYEGAKAEQELPCTVYRVSPDGGDLKAYVSRSIAVAPHAEQARIVLHAPYQEMARRIPQSAGVVSALDEGQRCQLDCGANDSLVYWLMALDVEFEVLAPVSLKERLRVAGERALRCA